MSAAASVAVHMPVGLPKPGADLEQHYANLATRLAGQIAGGTVAKVWVANEAGFSALAAMTKGFLRYLPAGAVGPAGTTLATPMLVLKPWLWDYLALRKGAGGTVLPRLIGYGNLDEPEVATAIRAEFAGNPRYSSLDQASRTTAEAAFFTGTSKVLVNVGTTIGRAAVDPAPPQSSLGGYRRLDLQFFDRAGTLLDPQVYFDIWALVGGAQVRRHPLVEKFSRPVTPSVVPIEGGTRIRVTGTGFAPGVNVHIGGQAAVDLTVAPAGDAVFGTTPPLPVGTADVVVAMPGKPTETYVDALTYVDDLATTTRAATLSYAINLVEIRDRALAFKGAGTLTGSVRTTLQIELDFAARALEFAIADRSVVTGESLHDPEVISIWEDAQPGLATLMTEAYAAIS